MTYNRFEDVSIDNPLPTEEVEGQTYSRFQPISPTNPFPVMVVDEDAYTKLDPISETNPYPIATGDGDAYSAFNELSETNRLPVVIVEGQSYSADAEVSMTNPLPVINTTEEDSYTGPLDLVPGALVAFSLRALSSAWRGQNVVRLRRSSDNAELPFAADAVTGDFPSAAAIAWRDALGAADAFVVTRYDQSGNGKNQTQSDPAYQPKWLPSEVGGKPSIVGLNNSDNGTLLESASLTLANSAMSYFSVSRGAGPGIVGTNGGAHYQVQLSGDSGSAPCKMQLKDGDEGDIVAEYDVTAFDDTTYYAWDGVLATGVENLKNNGVTVTASSSSLVGTVASVAAAGQSYLFDYGNPDGDAEFLLYGTSLSDGNLSSVRTNQMTYYGMI